MRYAGIDEAGYGPTLGPLAIVGVAVDGDTGVDLPRAFAGTGVRDSKTLHKPGNLAPLEHVALGGLAWLTGHRPRTAADVFAALGEPTTARVFPWQAGAEQLVVPTSAHHIPQWSVSGLTSLGLRGALIHADAYNHFITNHGNKADLELTHVRQLLTWMGDTAPLDVVVDRLGGRRFYGEALRQVWPTLNVETVSEAPAASRYHIAGRRVSFVVGGESASPLTALASCIAKYARELHQLLFNRNWSSVIPGLAPTAGYPEDARRWLAALGEARLQAFGPQLVRGWPKY
jgi:ribonuclease HII